MTIRTARARRPAVQRHDREAEARGRLPRARREHELFPKLAATLPPETLDELGRLVRRARQTAPTRPHPSLPHAPPAHGLLVPGAGLVERVRDLLRTTTR
uniref:hypothetical protein n=1 Tax=Streptomyces sp. NBC_01592 TaxID=2975889 RepID=UPI002F90FA37